jgi:hypothetical protein
MINLKKIMIGCTVAICVSGCAYRHYLGMHGPSMKAFPDIHQGVTEDQDCLSCHDPDQNPTGTPSTHPHFIGCLKCHNDDLK